MIRGLFAASVLLSVVSWYTTYAGMALYLSQWFAFLASLGVQAALLFTAWMLGGSRARRTQITVVYAITALVSVAFSYVSLYSWFSEKERPALIERQLFDRLSSSARLTADRLAAASAEARRHAVALEALAESERSVGHLSRSDDTDPYLARIREAVAREGRDAGPEGAGPGVRHAAFTRYARLARETETRITQAATALAQWRAQARPDAPSAEQLRAYDAALAGLSWAEVNETLHGAAGPAPAAPSLTEFADHAGSGQEQLLTAFTELVAAPTGRHLFALALAAFIDVIIFLIAFVSRGAPETEWTRASAALDSVDPQAFARELLRKVVPASGGLARIPAAGLSAGETQLLLLLVHRGLASTVEDGFLLDPAFHASLVEGLPAGGMPLRAHRAAA